MMSFRKIYQIKRMKRFISIGLSIVLSQITFAQISSSYHEIKVIPYLEAHANSFDFTEFTHELGIQNVEFLNNQNGMLEYGLGVKYCRFFFGGSFGIITDESTKYDSIKMGLNKTQYGFKVSYSLIDSKRILFSPRVQFNLSRFRLSNSSKDNRITFDQYLRDRDLDVRFNQLTSRIGFELSYKIHNGVFIMPYDYLTMGIAVDYVSKINNLPWIYSMGNRLISDKHIGVDTLQWGFIVTMKI
jgi:hypothetical protein